MYFNILEIDILDAKNTIISFMDKMPETYDIIAIFCNQSLISKDMKQDLFGRFPNLSKINICEEQEHGPIDAVDCASMLLNVQSDSTQISVLFCEIKRVRKLFQKIMEKISEQVAFSRKSIFSKTN
jgi:hypothetical protein